MREVVERRNQEVIEKMGDPAIIERLKRMREKRNADSKYKHNSTK